jgi:fatty-acyl-CoA synthase
MYKVKLTESYFPAQGGPEPPPMTIGDMLRASVARTPDQPALKELGYDGAVLRTWTYAGLLADAERLARALASRHAEGARIAVYANNIPEWVLLELGCALAGLTLVTVKVVSRCVLELAATTSPAGDVYWLKLRGQWGERCRGRWFPSHRSFA